TRAPPVTRHVTLNVHLRRTGRIPQGAQVEIRGRTPVRQPSNRIDRTLAAMTRRRRRSTYDVLPQWLTRKRAIVGVLLASVVFASVFGVRLSFALGKAFRTDPVSAVIAALQGGNGSSIDVRHRNLSRINIMLYGYAG